MKNIDRFPSAKVVLALLASGVGLGFVAIRGGLPTTGGGPTDLWLSAFKFALVWIGLGLLALGARTLP